MDLVPRTLRVRRVTFGTWRTWLTQQPWDACDLCVGTLCLASQAVPAQCPLVLAPVLQPVGPCIYTLPTFPLRRGLSLGSRCCGVWRALPSVGPEAFLDSS